MDSYESRFSSQMLNSFGESAINSFTPGDTSNISKIHINDSKLYSKYSGESGYYSPGTYNTVTAFFISRGASPLYANTMGSVVVDMSRDTGYSIFQIMENIDDLSSLGATDALIKSFNELRDASNQVGYGKRLNTSSSRVARQIKP